MESQETIQMLLRQARTAQRVLDGFSQAQVDCLAREIARTVYENAQAFARMAVDETRMGVYEDKVTKNMGKARLIWHSLKDEKTVGVLERCAGDVTTVARPVGVVGAILPCTNPVVTPMCNAMFAVKGRNAIIFAPHPRAKDTNKAVCDSIIRRIHALGAPEHIIQYIQAPTTDLSAQLMRMVDVIVATGGSGMVRAAYSSGRPSFGVGAGNVQCIIDRGYDASIAAPKIIAGRAFDNGIICSGEQSVIVHRDDLDAVVHALTEAGAVYVTDEMKVDALRKAVFPGGTMNGALVGQSAAQVAAMAGIGIPAGTRALLVRPGAYGAADPFSKEKMCPVLSLYPYTTLKEAAVIAQANLDVEGRGHSVSVHTHSRETAEDLAETLTVCRVLVNQVCATMNGGAFSNGYTATTTLGCGSWGGNSLSENLGCRHLLNIVRVGYDNGGVQPSEETIWGEREWI